MLSYFLPIYDHCQKPQAQYESRGAEAGVPRLLWPCTMNWTLTRGFVTGKEIVYGDRC